MLPPDISSTMFPWRVMVPAMQMYGCFPYRMSSASERPTFSLSLCLWSIFIFFLQALSFLESTNEIVQQSFSLELGSIAYTSFTVMTLAVLFVNPVAMGVKSGRVARILHDLSKITEVSPPPFYRWYCKPQTLLTIFLVALCTICSVVLTILSFATNKSIPMALLPPVPTLYFIGFLLPQEIISMVFGLLGRRLVAATESTVAGVSKLLASDGSLQCDSDVRGALKDLRNLEVVIRQVWLGRRK